MASRKYIAGISPEEIFYRLNQLSSAIDTRLTCNISTCGSVIRKRYISDKNIHPVLEVLVCKTCRKLFDKRNANGLHKSCDFCLKDYGLVKCSSCSFSFCQECIFNLSKDAEGTLSFVKEIAEKKWRCFVCFPVPIWKPRAICAEIKGILASNCDKEKKDVAVPSAVATLTRQTKVTLPVKKVPTRWATLTNSKEKKDVAVPSAVATQTSQTKVTRPVKKAPTRRATSTNSKKNLQVTNAEEKKNCVICWTEFPTYALSPCGHKCLCSSCVVVLSSQEDKLCPLCRKPFETSLRVYE